MPSQSDFAAALQRAGVNVYGLQVNGNEVSGRVGSGADPAYDEVEALDRSEPAVLVDFAGNGALKARAHAHLNGLAASHIVGDTDWRAPAGAELAGPRPELFFAPSAWEARAREIGPAAFEAELAGSLAEFLTTTPDWLTVETVTGADGHAAAFDRLLANRSPARLGTVWTP